jgi:hypothetical protein
MAVQQQENIIYVIGSRNSLDNYISLQNIGNEDDYAEFSYQIYHHFEEELHPNLYFIIKINTSTNRFSVEGELNEDLIDEPEENPLYGNPNVIYLQDIIQENMNGGSIKKSRRSKHPRTKTSKRSKRSKHPRTKTSKHPRTKTSKRPKTSKK